MCSLCTSISQEEGIDIVCHHYEEHYQSKLPILTSYFEDLMRVILTENFTNKFTDKHYVQTHGITVATKMAVAFSVIFMARVEKQLYYMRALTAISPVGRNLLITYSQSGLFLRPTLLISRTLSTRQ